MAEPAVLSDGQTMGRLLLTTAALLAGQAAAWRTFSPRDESFSVSMPAAPSEKVQSVPVKDGSNLEVRVFASADKEGTYVVSVTEFPAAEGNPERRLNNAREGAVASVQGKLQHERKIKLGGHPGRELWIEAGKSDVIHTRIYAVDKRLYQTLAIGPKRFVETKETTRFLDSFKLGK